MSYINRLPCLPVSGCIGPLQAAVDDKGWGRRMSGVIYFPGFLPTVWFWASCFPPTRVIAPLKATLSSGLSLTVPTTTRPLACHASGGNSPALSTLGTALALLFPLQIAHP